MSNRLNLDWQGQETSEARTAFIKQYMSDITFSPTEEELETIANYILYGKDSDGKSPVQKKQIEITPKHKTWSTQDQVDSLDQLRESPLFDESTITTPSTITMAIKKTTTPPFSRSEALEKAPDFLKEDYKSLFTSIDELELTCAYYDLAHGRRKEPPREILVTRLGEQAAQECATTAAHLPQWRYLKLRHLLVELRKQQYTLSDSYQSRILPHVTRGDCELRSHSSLGSDVEVYPLPLNKTAYTTYLSEQELATRKWTENELNEIAKICWRAPTAGHFYFDFRELEHVYQLLTYLAELRYAPETEQLDNNIEDLLRTLEFYIDFARLSPIHQEILEMKCAKQKNQTIATYINQKYNKSYTANYISTIFRQKIIKQINDAAAYHLEILRNLPFEENFDVCSKCGRTLLLSSRNFVKKTRSRTGFSRRCKECDRIERRANKTE